jgi:hypothetical protein
MYLMLKFCDRSHSGKHLRLIWYRRLGNLNYNNNNNNNTADVGQKNNAFPTSEYLICGQSNRVMGMV